MAKKPTMACDMGPQHAYLGHFGNEANLRKGHNTTETIPAKGGKPAITFSKGGLHRSTGTPMGQKIPGAKMEKALAGGFGPKAEKQARFKRNVLVGRG